MAGTVGVNQWGAWWVHEGPVSVSYDGGRGWRSIDLDSSTKST